MKNTNVTNADSAIVAMSLREPFPIGGSFLPFRFVFCYSFPPLSERAAHHSFVKVRPSRASAAAW